jgi:RimJ/RimL family protein N-acetyltransferase
VAVEMTPGRFAKPDRPFGDDLITLRTFSMNDVDAVVALCQDPEIPRWTTVPSPYAEPEARTWIAAHEAQWLAGFEASFAITDPNSGVVMGSVGLFRDLADATTSEIGYWVGADFRRRGIATRSVTLLSDWGAKVAGLKRMRLVTLMGNTASERVAQRAGFDRVGEVTDYRSERRPDVSSHVTVWQRQFEVA